MGNNDLAIASEKLFGQRPGEERFRITIEIGRPFAWGGTSPTEWACTITVKPLLSKPIDIHGEGALQALCLALRMVHSELVRFQENGGKLTLKDGEEFPLSAYFGRLIVLQDQSHAS